MGADPILWILVADSSVIVVEVGNGTWDWCPNHRNPTKSTEYDGWDTRPNILELGFKEHLLPASDSEFKRNLYVFNVFTMNRGSLFCLLLHNTGGKILKS